MDARDGTSMDARRGSARRIGARVQGRRAIWLGALALLLGMLVLLAGCDGGSTARTPATSPSTTGGQTPTASATSGGDEASPAPTLSPVATAQSQAGAGDVCDQDKNVTAQPPSSIPGYPGAELHISFIQNGSGLFGFCSSAAPSAIASYYTQQLPGKGWNSVQSHPLGDYQQVTGSQGETQLTITISPDARQSNVTDILITAQGL